MPEDHFAVPLPSAMQTKTNGRSLPKGWQWVKFGYVMAESQPGFASGKRDPKGVIQLRMNNVDTRGNLLWDEFIRVPAEQPTIEKYKLRLGDVVFNNTNSTELVGKSALFNGHEEAVVYSNHFTRLRAKSDVAVPGFVAYWLISQWQAKTFEKICNRWIGQSAVKTDKLFALEIPLPPLDEQRRIASRLNEQLAAVESARKAAEEQLQAAWQLPSAYLKSVFDIVSNGNTKNIADVCEIKGGKRLPSGTKFSEIKTSHPYIRVLDFENGTVNTSNLKYIDEETHKIIWRYIIKREDVYLSIAGTIGVAGIIPDELDGANLTENACRLVIKDKQLLDRNYLATILQSSLGQEQIKVKTNQVGQPKLALTRIATISLPVPPLKEQQRISAFLSEKLLYAKQLETKLESQLAEIESLPASLLREAFAGQL